MSTRDRVLITGGTGFIGARLARLAAAHYEVSVLGRVASAVEQARRNDLADEGVTVIDGSIGDEDLLTRLTTGCRFVFHLAAAQHEANVPDAYFRDVNVEGTRNVLTACARSGVERLVHGSTIGVYGEATDGQLDERSPTRPANIYGVTKLEAEALVRASADRVPAVIIRISETYGPEDRRLLKLFKAIKKRAFFVIGDGRNLHQLIYVDDLARGLIQAAPSARATGETLVLAGDEALTTTAMAEAVASAVGVPLRGLRAPMWPFLVGAVVMEKTLRPLGIQPPLHRRRLDFFRKSFLFAQDRARDILGFAPATSFREGAAATAAWYTERDLL